MVLDPVLVAVCSNIKTGMAMWAKSTLFKGFQGKILTLIGAVPVQRHKGTNKTRKRKRIFF
jgi:hypothetical protein